MVTALNMRSSVVALCGLLLLSACGPGAPKTPTGQVVATVGSREITQRELRLEMGSFKARNPEEQKAAEQDALKRIIQRVILADEARAQGLEKDPNFVLLSQRGIDTLLIHLLETRIAASVPSPTVEEAEQYQQTNPNLFANRQILDLDQIRFAKPQDPQFLKKLEPLKSLDDVAAFLKQQNIGFQRGPNTMDATGQNPQLLKAILALPPGEVFLLSNQSEVFVNQIREARPVALVGENATKFALNSLKEEHIQDAVARRIKAIVSKDAGLVRINKQFDTSDKVAKRPQAN
jgi:peptidyl-prolyl cis-trans isomerase C